MSTVTTGAPRRRRRGPLAALALVIAFATSGAYWLAGSSTTGALSISVDPGIAANNGSSVDLTAMSQSFTRPNGNAQLQAGLAIERITIAHGFADGL